MGSNLITSDIKEIIKNIYLCAYYYANSWYVSLEDEYLEELLPSFEYIFKQDGLDASVFTKNNTGKYDTYKKVLFELFVDNPERENEKYSRTKYGVYNKENSSVSLDVFKCEIMEEIESIKSEHEILIKKCAWYICKSFNNFEAYELLFDENNNDKEVKILEKSNDINKKRIFI